MIGLHPGKGLDEMMGCDVSIGIQDCLFTALDFPMAIHESLLVADFQRLIMMKNAGTITVLVALALNEQDEASPSKIHNEK
jgi:hypothetical protein